MALAANALTTVSTVEDELGISSGTETARLERMINQASAVAESYAGRVFYRDTAIAEKVRGQDGPFMFLSRAPINSITSVSYLSSTIDSDNYEIHGDGGSGILTHISGSWLRNSLIFDDIRGTRFSGGERKAYTVTYDGGWYTPKQEDDAEGTRTLPYDIESGVIMIVSFYRRSMGKDPSIKGESLLKSSVQYGGAGDTTSGSRWLEAQVPGAAGILARYKNVVLR